MKKTSLFLFLFFCHFAVLSQINPQNFTDILHYGFKLTLSDESDKIIGETTIKLRFTDPAKILQLNLSNQMTVSEVWLTTVKLPFSHENNLLTITLPDTLNTLIIQTFTVLYSGIPDDGLIISKNKFGERTFFGDNWPNRASHWLPVEDHPSDKATSEFIVTAPAHYQVISNGKLKIEKEIGNGLKLTHWQENTPIPTKVMVIGVAEFAIEKVQKIDSIEIQSWVFPKDEKKGFFDYHPAPKIISFFIQKVGPFSYEKLANVESKTIFGGMENASCIFYSENAINGEKSLETEGLLSHEIAHQWFGNSASEKDWNHIWLSEGFATYFSALYLENEYGKKTLNEVMYKNKLAVFRYANEAPNDAIIPTGKIENLMKLLNPNSYEKGGWVLHMLRHELGDQLFWKGIRKYYETYRNSNAETKDFQVIMEAVSGKKLEVFFNQWLYQPGYPKIEGNWDFNSKTKELKISIKQVQKGSSFNFPMEIGIYDSEKRLTVTEKVIIDQSEKHYTFKLKNPVNNIALDPDHWILMKVGDFTRVSK